jgi:hypothetical protein
VGNVCFSKPAGGSNVEAANDSWRNSTTAVALARVGGLNHFPSDVLAGAVMGELIGSYVVNHRQAKAAE